MDIVTHAMAGTIIASPFLSTAPISASCFILGSVLPDTDALSRMFGKVAFLRWHQTYTHSLPIIFSITILLWSLGNWFSIAEAWAPIALGAGLLLHALMDATNTYGVALMAPFSRRRCCTEWVFFIDGIVIAVSAVCLAVVLIHRHDAQDVSLTVSVVYGSFLAAYWTLRGLLHWRAGGLAPPDTLSLIPAATIPWRFFGCAMHDDVANLFNLSLFKGEPEDLVACPTFDSKFENLLKGITEYRLMRELSPGYCTVEATEHHAKTQLVCRDLRIRNFGGRFGLLDLTFDAQGRLERKIFHV